ncbi:tyrosine-protein phosphatase [Pseudonocardia endophytica]|uniref:Tyrosine phosphatase family protein n=1 Tax=Pseudonocardia endophytica TaxID=401976 RepID=A0A4R1HVC3_PSEEN|nr:tyrosine-protein phosphatase [Pseudonocardia endophytica]TCK21422.1 tyrosine phosphatase family protein [Pseudonocardia endophytica]
MTPGRVTPAENLHDTLGLRDLGGLRAGAEHRVRPGVLFRGRSPHTVTDMSAGYLADDLWLELVLDLRPGGSAAAHGRGPLSGRPVSYLNAPLSDVTLDAVPDHERGLRFCLHHLAATDSPLSTAVRSVCAMAGRPLLLCCETGTGRTDLLVAILLRIAGVDDDEISTDYVRVGSRPPYTIRALLGALDNDFGGALAWARHRGISALDCRRLRDGLLVPG